MTKMDRSKAYLETLINRPCLLLLCLLALTHAQAESTEAQTPISSAVIETSLSGTLKVFSHARSGEKLDGSYKIIEAGGSYTLATFRDGVLEGSWERYSSQRILREKGNYVAGRVDGEYTRFTSSGKLKSVEAYDNGVAHGVWKGYSRQGNVIEAVT